MGSEPLPIVCESERISSTAMINGISELDIVTPDLFQPASEGGDVRISNIPSFNCTIEITDLQGRIVKQFPIQI